MERREGESSEKKKEKGENQDRGKTEERVEEDEVIKQLKRTQASIFLCGICFWLLLNTVRQ